MLGIHHNIYSQEFIITIVKMIICMFRFVKWVSSNLYINIPNQPLGYPVPVTMQPARFNGTANFGHQWDLNLQTQDYHIDALDQCII